MKKIVKLLFVFLLGFMIIPMVHAEDLPTEGVTYFMDYPNGEEEVTLEYDKANDPEEVLIFSGMTDSNGKINLCDWSSTGQLRIVQEVPAGYTTTTKEVKVDLSRDNVASFINYRGLDNPKTGRSILVFLGIIGVVTITILVSRKNKKSLLIIPIIVGVLAVTYVKAETCFCIQVKDGSGKALANVHIDVYAKPNKIEAYPAIVYDANGGKFFDGKEKMYIRIPHDDCTSEEFYSSFTIDDFSYLQENLALVYRDGYRMSGASYNGSSEIPTTLKNGMVLKIDWEEQEESTIVEVNGNGGVINYHGKKIEKSFLNSVTKSYVLNKITTSFTNGNKRFIGYDTKAACSRFNSYGIQNNNNSESDENVEDSKIYYACWNESPDGIYVNDELFIGTNDTCFKESNASIKLGDNDDFSLYSNEGSNLYIGDYTLDDIYLVLTKERIIGILNNYNNPLVPLPDYDGKQEITKLEIVKNGETVVSLTEDDFEYDGGNYYILNDDKRPIVMNYIAVLDENDCFGI